MIKKIGLIGMLGAVAMLGACSERITIPPVYIGKLNTASGLSEEVIPPSTIRLSNMCVTCDDLMLAETSDRQVVESITVFMPKDQLNVEVDIRAILSIESDAATVNPVFGRIPSTVDPKNDRLHRITFGDVYKTYGSQALRETTRSVLAEYSINQVMENRAKISKELETAIVKELKGTPITVKSLGLADAQFPESILAAKIEARATQEMLKTAEAKKRLALEQKEIDLIEAQAQAEIAEKLAQGVSPAFVTQRWLKVMEELAGNDQKTVIILPAEAIGDPAVMMPTMNRAFR